MLDRIRNRPTDDTTQRVIEKESMLFDEETNASTFESQVIKKRQKDISDINQKIISMYAKGMTTRQISSSVSESVHAMIFMDNKFIILVK